MLLGSRRTPRTSSSTPSSTSRHKEASINDATLAWFETERGLDPDTLGRFGVVAEGDEWIAFPYSYGNKLRSNPTIDGPRRFQNPKGASLDLFGPTEQTATMFLTEGETDTMRLSQELGHEHTVLGLPGVTSWQPRFAERFSEAERIYVVLDNDPAYAVGKTVEKAWKQIRNDLGKKAKRVVLPAETKDVCEFFDRFNLDLFKELCARRNPVVSRLTRLDLRTISSEPDWLVKDILCSGDVNLLVGDPGLGKSFLTMDLAIKVARGQGEWLGFDVLKQGRTLYIDEENPEDLILRRFKKLGLTEGDAGQITYLHRPGIWLNKEPEVLLDEAIELEPTLIILDSLTPLHSLDENNSNAMRGLFKEAISPLARDTGATVIVIHHTTKAEDASSYRRARGSGDITAVIDSGLDAKGTDTEGVFTVSQYKSRRRLANESVLIEIKDNPDGTISIGPKPLPF